jgi:hypothetical protein
LSKTQVIKYAKKYPWTSNSLISSKTNVPTWYKDIQPPNTTVTSLPIDKNVKSCIPFLDAFTIGYQIPLWADLAVEKTNEGTRFTWNTPEVEVIGERPPSMAPGLPIPVGYSPAHYIWKMPNFIETPLNYSIIVTHPFNRADLPFLTLTGVVDSDSIMWNGNIPFFIKEDFEGVIPMGTPIAQVIPFKREEWTSKEDSSLVARGSLKNKAADLISIGYYKKFMWKKKSYD